MKPQNFEEVIMNKYTVISNHDHQITCDHVFAVSGDAALITVAAARPGAQIIVAIPGHRDDICFAGEGMVDANQLIENAGGNDSQMDVLRSVLAQEGFQVQQSDTGSYFWKSHSGAAGRDYTFYELFASGCHTKKHFHSEIIIPA